MVTKYLKYIVYLQAALCDLQALGQDQLISNPGFEPASMPFIGGAGIFKCERSIPESAVPGWRSIRGIVDAFEYHDVTSRNAVPSTDTLCQAGVGISECSADVFDGCISLLIEPDTWTSSEYPWPLIEARLSSPLVKGQEYRLEYHMKVTTVLSCDTVRLTGFPVWFSTETNTDLDDHKEGDEYLTSKKARVVIDQEVVVPIDVEVSTSSPWICVVHKFMATE
jgi:hypothetical protein